MSRIGRAPIVIPAGVTVTLEEGNLVKVKGPKGELSRALHPEMKITVEDNTVKVERPSEDKKHKSLHGLTRTLIHNMVVGVTETFSKTLEISGVGYRAVRQGNNLNLSLGFSHPCIIEPPKGITLDAPAANQIVISGIDKELVGEMAAKIRSLREPEPYKGKGIRYAGEKIRRKAGKTGAKGK